MKDTGNPPTIRSILVALDDACSDHETMEAAAQLAADLHAELQGLYVEDVNVLRMAALPFTEEITAGSGVARPIDAESMERAMQNKAEHVRRLMERTAAQRADSLFLLRRPRPRARNARCWPPARPTWCCVGSRSHAPAVRPPLGARTRSAVRPIVAVVDATAVSARTLDTAAAVSECQGRGLVVLICDGERDVVGQLAGRVRDELAARGGDVNVPPGPIHTVAALIQSAQVHRAALVLLSRECRLLDEVAMQTLLENLDCSIVLV